MKKNNFYFIIFLFFINCNSQNKDYKVVHLSNDEVQAIYYFHSNNEEFARVYGNSFKNDSLTFKKEENNLIVQEFSYDEKQKKRLFVGNIKYVNYYTTLSEIVSMGNIFFINETPIKDFNFTKKDTDMEKIIEENCQKENGLYSYSDCDFVLSKNDELPYFPNNSIILSFKVKKEKSFIQEMEIKAKYFDESFNYKRNYYYKNEKIEKIITSIEDDASKNSYEDNFIMEKL